MTGTGSGWGASTIGSGTVSTGGAACCWLQPAAAIPAIKIAIATCRFLIFIIGCLYLKFIVIKNTLGIL
jgi:hypothetical protein